jgi:hypothetical protein
MIQETYWSDPPPSNPMAEQFDTVGSHLDHVMSKGRYSLDGTPMAMNSWTWPVEIYVEDRNAKREI